ncbi:glycosyltransferase family 2 protein [Weissella cibaria]|uniref:glycosyltransferase family 2 protein n=1 Tax=Weissella cibaria TaxID=137591 RepID=UPI0018975C85|nr:glycosyltransferase family A protein [Weissella cibaria]
MEQISISVVIPAYNSAATIDRSVNSVLRQTFIPDAFEIIIVDDGSKDETIKVVEEIIKKHPNWQIRLLKKSNGGVSSARNMGIINSKHDWIMFLDSDDVWVSKKIEIQARTISENPRIDFLGGNVQPELTKIPFVGILSNLHRVKPIELLIKWVPQTSTVLVRKSILEGISLYDETMRYAEDGDLYLRIAEQYNFYVQQVQLVEYGDGKRMFGDSGLSGNLKGMLLGNIVILNKAFRRNSLSVERYMAFYLWNVIKYMRRVMVVNLEKGKKNYENSGYRR